MPRFALQLEIVREPALRELAGIYRGRDSTAPLALMSAVAKFAARRE
jgi:hypothetical protein